MSKLHGLQGDGLSLYFRLRDGEKADLEVVSAAAIAWVETIKAAAAISEPDSRIRVELVDADESSLIYNTLVRVLRAAESGIDSVAVGYESLPRARRIALGAVPFLIFTAGPTYDTYFGADDLSEEEATEVHAIIDQARENQQVRVAGRRLYREVEREPIIEALSVRETATGPDIAQVEAKHFAEAGGLWDSPEEDVTERINHPILQAVLVKPALVHSPRAWTFKPDGLPEFEAIMRDPAVLNAMHTGLPERMREGISMTLRLEVREVLVDGKWKLIRGGRSVLKVIDPPID